MKSRYQWQGEPVKVKFGYVHQEENEEKPMYWYNFECYNNEELDGSFKENHFVLTNGKKFALIPTIKVMYGDDKSFLLANHFGIGVHKLLKGGWPNCSHFSVDGKFNESDQPYYKITKFNIDEYERYENARRVWQKKNYPTEFERLDQLRKGFLRK